MNVFSEVRKAIGEGKLFSRGETIVVAVSGGPDSLALLDILNQLAPSYRWKLHVAHLHHGIRGEEADADADFVRNIAERLSLPFHIRKVDVPRLASESHTSIEEAARQARYRFLAEVALETGASRIALGHHMDDQVETVLMHFLRGSGLAGLRGMLPISPMEEMRLDSIPGEPPETHGLFLVRPMLSIPHQEIVDFCRGRNLQPRFDRSNLDTTYYRNRLRHELIPTLETYNPKIKEIIFRSSQIFADDYDLLHRETLRAWEDVTLAENEILIFIDLRRWQGLHPSLQRGVLREAIHRLRRSLRNINWAHVETARKVALKGETGSGAPLPDGLKLMIEYERILIGDEKSFSKAPVPQITDIVEVKVPGSTDLGGGWFLETEYLAPEGVPVPWPEDPWQAWLDVEKLEMPLFLRQRKPGDRFKPLGMKGSMSVGEFMINEKLPARWREKWPILSDSQGKILWIPGYRPSEEARITDRTRKVLWLHLHHKG